MLVLKVDYRLGNNPRYYLGEGHENLMQIPPEIKRCVVFLLYNSVGGERLAGTAFFVNVPLVDGKYIPYLITAKHVLNGIEKHSIDTDNKVIIRINLTKGGTRSVISKRSDWQFHPDKSVDAAALRLVLPLEFDYLGIPSTMTVTDKVIQDEAINVGDEVFLTGLFYKHYGKQKNLPLIRVGNIAMMPDEKIEVGHGFGEVEAYLVESRSIGGLSGSPVFVHLGNMRPINGTITLGGNRNLFYWLGLMHGHWNVGEDMIDSIEDDMKEDMNVGIAVVIPASKIMELLNCDEYVAEREKFNEALKKEHETVLD